MKQKILILSAICMSYLITTQAQTTPTPVMVKVEGGTFQMGDEQGLGDFDEQPVHTVTLKTFSIAKTETTVLQWKTFCSETGRQMPESPSWGWIDDHPIVNVSWDDASAYGAWLSGKTGKIYRLPTEAEWEFAARGGALSKGYKYSGGKSLDKVGWYEPNSNDQTQPTAKKRANELGLYDMSGNVWEWCMDWHGLYSAEAQTNPKGAKTGPDRVIRGGGWYNTADGCRAARRYYYEPSSRRTFMGFRLISPE